MMVSFEIWYTLEYIFGALLSIDEHGFGRGAYGVSGVDDSVQTATIRMDLEDHGWGFHTNITPIRTFYL